MTESVDRVLIEKTLHGDELAFAELVSRYQPIVWRTVRRRLADHFESEDAMQEIFMRAFSSLHRFDTSRPFDHWILRISTNYCIDILRSRRARRSWLFEEYREVRGHCDRQDAAAPGATADFELERFAGDLLNSIKSRNRHAFVLRELEGWAYGRIGATLQITPLAARARVFRARQEMHRKLRTMMHRRIPTPVPLRAPQPAHASTS
jgi:RNA polymerase sigma-70 factor, ECF subfamily